MQPAHMLIRSIFQKARHTGTHTLFSAGHAPVRSPRYKRLVLFILSSMLLFSQVTRAQWDDGVDDPPLVNMLTGTSTTNGLVANNTLVNSYSGSGAKFKNLVTLSVIEETPTVIAADFTATVTVKIEYGPNSTSLSVMPNQNLSVSYSKAEGVKYNSRNYVSFEGAAYVRVTVITPPSGMVGTVDVRNLIRLENELRVTHNLNLSTLSTDLQPSFITHTPPGSGADELPVSWGWPANAGHSHTQLEWVYVEDSLLSNYQTNNVTDYNRLFKNNATRIDLPFGKDSCKIPLLYGGKGNIYFRIRAVNIKKAGTRKDGPWSSVQSDPFAGHNDSLNWQVTLSFAEEGKRKAVMQYYDGSLRSRQTVTKDNTTGTTLTAETLYDDQGRPAIQILPAPGIANTIRYSKGLNLFQANTTLNLPADQTMTDNPVQYFDLQPLATATSITPALKTSAGASQYYSAAYLTVDANANKNTPDAEGYPYTVTRYTPDATGRILAQSGEGAALKMGSGHETKYYYGTPSQEQLDGLFGTEVGYNTHYFKNMVRDANGQMSVSYVDMHGRTIATALAGDAPANTAALSITDTVQYKNQKSTNYITQNLLANNANTIKNNSLEAINTLLVPARTVYSFTYNLNPDTLGLKNCTAATLCFDCMYNLEISITDESGDIAPIVKKYNNINLAADTSCATGVKPFQNDTTFVSGNNIQFSQTLDPGSYIIRKTLTISEASLERYKQVWAKDSIGLCKTEQQLIDSVATVMLASSSCGNAPADACTSCNAALGTQSAYRTNYLASLGNPSPVPAALDSEINASYAAAKLNCDRLCNTGTSVLASKRQLMLLDMIPYSGQYARDTGTTSMYNKYNIFSTGNASTQPFYKKPWNANKQLNYYYTPFNQIDPTIHPGTPPDQTQFLSTLSSNGFAQLFNPKWAEALLPHHPEYDKLVFAENNLTGSYNWINTFQNTTTYAQASTNGYIFTTTASINDPFYALTSPASTGGQKTQMGNWVTTNYRNGLSMWQIAYGDVKCKDILAKDQREACYTNGGIKVPPYSNLTTAENDQVWAVFKGLYALERENHVNDYINANAPALADTQTLVDQKFLLHFPSNRLRAQQYSNNGNDWSWYPATPGADPNLTNFQAGTTPQTTYNTQCSSYIALWTQALLQCDKIKNHVSKDSIISKITTGMQAVCVKGSNEANPFGSSNVAPSTPNDGSYRSFENVVDSVFSMYGITKDSLCNVFVIDYPKPYGKGPEFYKAVTGVVDTCNCKQFAQIKNEAAAAGKDPNVLSSLNQYLQSKYGDTLTAFLYNGMMQNCSRLGIISCKGDCNTRTCDSTGAYYTLLQPQPLPAFLKCGFTANAACQTCAGLSSLVTEFKSLIPAPYNAGPVFGGAELTSTNIRDNVLFAQFVNYRTGMQYGWMDYAQAATAANCNLANFQTNSSQTQNVICGKTKPLTDTTGVILRETSCQLVKNMAVQLGQKIYSQRKQAQMAYLDSAYRAKCLGVQNVEVFNVSDTVKEYHYTLYYYDMAGNLLKTVPPKGVRPDFSTTYTNQVKADRASGTANLRPHLLTTNYRYNSLGGVTQQNTPDAGTSKFWYDRLGRLAVSQNAQQAIDGKYSYTLYDVFGRIMEVGQKPQTTAMTQVISQDTTALKNWITVNGGTREQITMTGYDEAFGTSTTYPNGIFYGLNLTQRNLRNRVSYSATFDTYPAVVVGNQKAGTFYTYDVHGNVDTLLQDYRGLPEVTADSRYKRIVYDYDLISGKVNMVSYNADYFSPATGLWTRPVDKFFHKYLYDDENRVTEVQTSRDKLYWERDAAYSYYKHGPLARTVLGKLTVQGLDYAYTLQGWLKGVNSTNVTSATDMGGDGLGTGNSMVAKDILGFSLHYFDTTMGSTVLRDYLPIGGSSVSAFARPNNGAFVSLYNGNIGGISINNAGLLKAPAASTISLPLFYNYRYDQLNRLVSMTAYKGLDATTNQWTPVVLNDYREAVSYDPNGNILKYNRNGSPSIAGNQVLMDSLLYQYYYYDAVGTRKTYDPTLPLPTDASRLTNQLAQVSERVSSPYTQDLENQGVNNYSYDAIGNLTADVSEGITAIAWNVYGKILSITKSTGTITYTYDASGNRISKTSGGKTTLYVRDAGGNVLSVYEATTGSGVYQQTERHLYGSSRLGIANGQAVAPTKILLAAGYDSASVRTFVRGEKSFELSNHLGNVLITITDKKIQHDGGSGTVDYYTADVANAQDYYPFGMQMPGRTYNGANYRYGFNGKENDNEVKGTGNQQDYGMRIYDPRLGRFLSVDPLTKDYSNWSPFAFAMNCPIAGIDLDGLEFYYNTNGQYLGHRTTDANGKKLDKKTSEDVRLASGVTTAYDEKTKTTYIIYHDVQDLNISHKEFMNACGIISQEGETFGEYSWFAHAIKNITDENKNSYLKELKLQSTVGRNGGSGDRNKLISDDDGNVKANNSRAAVLGALSGAPDPTGGATQWDGMEDFFAWGLNHAPMEFVDRNGMWRQSHAKFREYGSITISGDIYVQALDILISAHPSGQVRYSKFTNQYDCSHIWDIMESVFNRPYLSETGNFYHKNDNKLKTRLIATGIQGKSIYWKVVKE